MSEARLARFKKRGLESEAVEDGWWYDPVTGTLGWGPVYGERSFNGKLIGAVYGKVNIDLYLGSKRSNQGEFSQVSQ